MISKQIPIYNLSFGIVLPSPKVITFVFTNIGNRDGGNWRCSFIFNNSAEFFENENKLEEYHSNNNQKFQYNKSNSFLTGLLTVEYEDFPDSEGAKPQNILNNFFQNYISLLLGFFQRRRVIFGKIEISNSTFDGKYLPMLVSAEFTDAKSWGICSVPIDKTFEALETVLGQSEIYSIFENTYMLLLRYKESLNLPYSYEKIEIFWRILETLGDASAIPTGFDVFFSRIKDLIGMRKDSATLHKIIEIIIKYNIPFTDEQIKNSFNYRNLLTHEYLNTALLNDPKLMEIFNFLNTAVEIIIMRKVDLPMDYFVQRSFGAAQHIVLG